MNLASGGFDSGKRRLGRTGNMDGELRLQFALAKKADAVMRLLWACLA